MKTYSRLTLAFLLLILVVPQVGADEPPKNEEEVTVWSDGSGKFKIEAAFVELVNGKLVVLKRASDGKVIKVPLDKLDKESKSQAKSLHADAEAQPKQRSLEQRSKDLDEELEALMESHRKGQTVEELLENPGAPLEADHGQAIRAVVGCHLFLTFSLSRRVSQAWVCWV